MGTTGDGMAATPRRGGGRMSIDWSLRPSGRRLNRIARRQLSLDRLRPGQRAAAEAAVGRDVLAVLPTGSGKSAIYQVVAAAFPGPTVVVSPLIALQRDQVAGSRRTWRRGEVNSSVGAATGADAFDALLDGDLEFVFLAPEQLAREDTLERRRRPSRRCSSSTRPTASASGATTSAPTTSVSAHVVEALGHPSCSRSPPLRRRRCGPRSSSALAARPRRRRRGLRPPQHLPGVERLTDAGAKRAALVDRAPEVAEGAYGHRLRRDPQQAEELAEALGAGATGRLPRRATRAARRRWTPLRHGDRRWVVATTAFGMGIDMPDVRFVSTPTRPTRPTPTTRSSAGPGVTASPGRGRPLLPAGGPGPEPLPRPSGRGDRPGGRQRWPRSRPAGGAARTARRSPHGPSSRPEPSPRRSHLLEDAGLVVPVARRPGAPSTTGRAGLATDEAVAGAGRGRGGTGRGSTPPASRWCGPWPRRGAAGGGSC